MVPCDTLFHRDRLPDWLPVLLCLWVGSASECINCFSLLLTRHVPGSPSTDKPINAQYYSSLDFCDSATQMPIPLPTPDDVYMPRIWEDTGVVEEEAEDVTEEVRPLKLSDINVVCMTNLRWHLRLKELARAGVNVEYQPLQNVRFVFINAVAVLLLFRLIAFDCVESIAEAQGFPHLESTDWFRGQPWAVVSSCFACSTCMLVGGKCS